MIELIHGDCLEEMKKIPDGSIDLVLTDPPYGTTACKWDTVIPFEPMWEHILRITKPNASIVLTANQPFTSALVMSNPKMFKYQFHWNKKSHSNPLLSKKQPLRVMEDVLVFYKKQPTYNPQMRYGKPNKKDYDYVPHTTDTKGETRLHSRDNTEGLFYPTNYLEIPQNKNNRTFSHPTAKPVALMEYLIKTYTNEGETVLDFTMGSGTTGVACKNLNRNFIGIELDEQYFSVAKERINSTQPPLL